jgi:hypothetical protein
MTVNVKQSKTDHQRMGSTLLIGATRGRHCPVAYMQEYLRDAEPEHEGPLFPGLQYATMLKATRKAIRTDSDIYGLHSFRVGGAQALALAGCSYKYIMARGRWKHAESVIRYVETPAEVMAGDSRAMEMATASTANGGQHTTVWGRTHSHQERERAAN